MEVWGWWIFPNITWPGYNPAIVFWFRFVASLLILCVIIPMILDLKGTKVHVGVLILITAIFALPFAFLAYIWMPTVGGSWVAILFLLLVLLFILLMQIAK
ncbi:MAG: hypothetical protein RBG13Loki_0621 [Promethearchaeota archaeon CR_4]|nr:MAG: hypothetical protein RBG13Loki_0621 [Candidatus Lokiarchaeota archaeon CR_4]